MIGQIVYIDESGNDGDVAGNPAVLTKRPTFVLAGVLEQDGSAAAMQLVERLRLDHHFQAKDLKWKSFAKKPAAFLQLIRELRHRRMVPFVEVMNRRHYVANNLMTYVLGRRRLDFAEPEALQIANDCADAAR